MTKQVTSNQYYKGHGQLIQNENAAFEIQGNVENVLIEDFHFHNCTFGVYCSSGIAENIIIKDCVFYADSEQGSLSHLVYAIGQMNKVTLTNCTVRGRGMLALALDCYGWHIESCSTQNSYGQAINLFGNSHSIVGNTFSYSGGEAISINKGVGYGGLNLIERNAIKEYGLRDAVSRGAIVVATDKTIIRNNYVTVATEGATAERRCLYLGESDLSIHDNHLAVMDNFSGWWDYAPGGQINQIKFNNSFKFTDIVPVPEEYAFNE